MVDESKVDEVIIQGQELTVTDINGRRFKVFAPQDVDLIKTLRVKNVKIKAKPPADSPWYNVLSPGFP
jgi:cell division protease FtsH